MIIDVILDRRDNEETMKQGFTHAMLSNGRLVPLAYDPHAFYRLMLCYGEMGEEISRAMDYGTEEDVKTALCDYITRNDYNPEICNYVNSRTWLE